MQIPPPTQQGSSELVQMEFLIGLRTMLVGGQMVQLTITPLFKEYNS